VSYVEIIMVSDLAIQYWCCFIPDKSSSFLIVIFIICHIVLQV